MAYTIIVYSNIFNTFIYFGQQYVFKRVYNFIEPTSSTTKNYKFFRPTKEKVEKCQNLILIVKFQSYDCGPITMGTC